MTKQAEQEKKLMIQNLQSQNLDESRKNKLVREEEERMREQMTNERSKGSLNFNAYEQRQIEQQNRM